MNGLVNKYRIIKLEGVTDPFAQYFVLRMDTDPHARAAARAYAKSVQYENPKLADELLNLVVHCETAIKLGAPGVYTVNGSEDFS